MDERILALVNTKVISEMPADKKETGILEILAIAVAVVRLIKACKDLKKEELLPKLNHPNFFSRLKLRRELRKECRKNNKEEDFNEIVSACLKGGEKATLSDADVLLQVASMDL